MLIQTLEFNVAMVTMSGWSSLPPPLALLIQAGCSTTRFGVILSLPCDTVTYNYCNLYKQRFNIALQHLKKSICTVELSWWVDDD